MEGRGSTAYQHRYSRMATEEDCSRVSGPKGNDWSCTCLPQPSRSAEKSLGDKHCCRRQLFLVAELVRREAWFAKSSRGGWRATERAMQELFDKALVSFGEIIACIMARIVAQIGRLQFVPQLKSCADRDMLNQGVRWDEGTRYCGSPRARTEVGENGERSANGPAPAKLWGLGKWIVRQPSKGDSDPQTSGAQLGITWSRRLLRMAVFI